jgi:hypothetical protein
MPLVSIDVESIYKSGGQRVSLPARMAHCTPDMKGAIQRIGDDLKTRGGHLYLSDLFRSYDMQLQSHLDFVNKKKTAYSPPPGGSMHEAGRALDLDLGALKISLADFWPIAKANGLTPIVAKPNPTLKESWHFDCRGSHDRVYQYYAADKGTNMKPYQAMATSAILSVGIKVDRFGSNQQAAAIQAALIRLGHELGNIDGSLGTKSQKALADAGVPFSDLPTTLHGLEQILNQQFPQEAGSGELHDEVPEHVHI